VARLRLNERQWRIYLAVWLAALAAIVGAILGLTIPRLLTPSPPPVLVGGLVMDAHAVPAPDFTLRDQLGSTVSLSHLRGKVVALTFLDTQCLNLCPLQANLLGGVQSDLGPRDRTWADRAALLAHGLPHRACGCVESLRRGRSDRER
jgi:cytochrome oxidase Cu insertion factor (SCO1/SenC/PrrC family)